MTPLPIAGVKPSTCVRPQSRSSARRVYRIDEPGTSRGTYRGYGDPRLLPVRVTVRFGDHGAIDGILQGATTDLAFDIADPFRDAPRPVSHVAHHPAFANLWAPQVRRDDARATVLYRYPLTSSTWEIVGEHRARACLYFETR